MKITVLGAGGAFTYKQFHSNFLMEFEDEKILFDCGSDIRWSLKEQGIDINTITGVYISHLHADHVGGLEFLAFHRYFNKGLPKMKLYIAKYLIDELWGGTLRGGLATVEGKDLSLDDYFDIVPMFTNEYIGIKDYKFEIEQVYHIVSPIRYMPAYGLEIKLKNRWNRSIKNLFITGDTCFDLRMSEIYAYADIILHDCETSIEFSEVHANYQALKSIKEEYRNKMWLYHYGDNVLENWDEFEEDAKDNGFKGFLKMGQILEFKEDKLNAEEN